MTDRDRGSKGTFGVTRDAGRLAAKQSVRRKRPGPPLLRWIADVLVGIEDSIASRRLLDLRVK